jgi:hypothetical protein
MTASKSSLYGTSLVTPSTGDEDPETPTPTPLKKDEKERDVSATPSTRAVMMYETRPNWW